MSTITITVGVSGGSVSYNSPTVTVSGTQTILWVPASGVTINSLLFATSLPSNPTISSSGGTFTVVDSNALAAGQSATTYNYSMVVQPSTGTPITGADPEIINSPPAW